MRVLMLGPSEGWHAEQLQAAATAEGHQFSTAEYDSIHAVGPHAYVTTAEGREDVRRFDVVLSRTMPAGSMEQITYRLAVLHHLVAIGARVINPPAALEIAIDKHATSCLFSRMGIATPPWATSQNARHAMDDFSRLGGDCVVKPLFGGEGAGLVRVTDSSLAWRTFRAIEVHGGVIYQQQFIPPGGRDLRILVLGDVLLAVQRENPDDWRTNVRQGGQSRPANISPVLAEQTRQVFAAAGLLYGAIDFCIDQTGQLLALELNAVPGWRGAQSALEQKVAPLLIAAATRRAASHAVGAGP